jgi:choline/glycine/proline betaine transport protein
MRVNPYVFFTSGVIALVFVLLGALFSDQMGQAFESVQSFIVAKFGWFYIASVATFLVFVLWLLVSRYGQVRLGKDDEEPAYSYFTWFSMLFSAGMGIGLLFYGVAEPVLHFAQPPRASPETVEAARDAIRITFFHWGLHAWAIYIVVGLSLAYFAYRHDLPLTIRSALYPLLGRHVHGRIGDLVDTLAVFGTLFGLATSLGLGVMQINAGLSYLDLMEVSTQNQIILITLITLAATVSVVTGVDRGIRRLSEANLTMAMLLLLFVFFVGPTVFLLSSFVQSVGRYASSLVEMTLRTDAFIGLKWQKSWTMFYWGWWISWSPFVGMFIARVSRGRTIREFVAGVLLVPTLLTFFWMVVFGDTALHIELFGEGGIVAPVSDPDTLPTAIFVLLEKLPLSSITATLATIVVAIFFVTSSDSGSLVVDILTSGGHPDPPISQRVFWALMEGTVAAILLVTGGLTALQTAAITTALPFCVIILLICWSLVRGLRAERVTSDAITDLFAAVRHLPASTRRRILGAPPAGAPPGKGYGDATPVRGEAPGAAGEWREQLDAILRSRERAEAQAGRDKMAPPAEALRALISDVVLPAFRDLEQELTAHGRQVTIQHDATYARLTVWRGDVEELSFAVRGQARDERAFVFPEIRTRRELSSGKAEVVTRSGRQAEHDVCELTRDDVIQDFLEAYDKWMGW